MTQPVAQVRHVVARTGFANPLTLQILVADEDYLRVFADDTELNVGDDYVIAGIGSPNGVAITIIGADDVNAYAGVESFTAVYQPPLDQLASLSTGGGIGRPFETALDQQNRRLQSIGGRVDRALKVPVYVEGDIELPPPVNGGVLVWDDDEGGFVWGVPGGVPGAWATQEEAIEGLRLDRVMSPGRTRDFVETYAQPLDEDLSEIAALNTQPFGRDLLTMGTAEATKDRLRDRKTVALLLADTDLTYAAGVNQVAAGDRVTAQGFRYEVAATDATDHHIETAGGVKLYVLPDPLGFNVLAFGAIGDAVAENHAAIQTAINAARKIIPGVGSEMTGAVVYFPAGHYYVNANLDLTANAGVSLIGATGTKSTLRGGPAVTRLLDFSGGNNYRGIVKNMRLTGGIGGSLPCIAYVYGGGNQLHFIENWIDSALCFLDTDGFADCKIINNTFEYVRTLFGGQNYYDLTVSGNMFYHYGPQGAGTQPNPFNFLNSHRVAFFGNKIVWDRAAGISTAAAMINIENAHDITLANNVIYDRPGSTYPMRGIRVLNSRKITISGGSIGRTNGHTIDIDGSSGVSVVGVGVIGTTNAAVWTVAIQGNSRDVLVSGVECAQVDGVDYSNLANNYDILLNGSERAKVIGCSVRKPIYIQSNNSRFSIEANTKSEPGPVYAYGVFPPVPAGKSWEQGDYIPAAAPAAGGHEGLICSISGTSGTLNGGATTGDITTGTATLTVSDATGLVVGQYINIAGVTGRKAITAIAGTSITLSANADATVTGAAVSFAAPTFKLSRPIAA